MPDPQVNQLRSIRVIDIPWLMDATYLFSCFHDNAEVVAATVLCNRDTGRQLGYGFVEFASHSDAESVLKGYHGERMPNFIHERFSLSWDTDGLATMWRWDADYRLCTFFGYDEHDNMKDALTVLAFYEDLKPEENLKPSAVTKKRIYLQSCGNAGEAFPHYTDNRPDHAKSNALSTACYMETDFQKSLKLTDTPLTHPNMYQQGYDQVPIGDLEMVSSIEEEKELYLGFEEVNYRRSCYVFRTIKMSELLECSCGFSIETSTITKCKHCASKTKKGSQLLQRAWLFTGERVPESCSGKEVKIPTCTGCCAYGSRIIFAGGLVPRPDEAPEWPAFVPSGDVYSFEPESNMWERLDWSFPKAEPDPLLFEVNGKVYCLASGPEGGPLEHPSSSKRSTPCECLVLPDPQDSIPELDNWSSFKRCSSFNQLACAVVGSKILISRMENSPEYDIPIICFDVNDKEQKWSVMASLFDGKPFPFEGRALVLDLNDGTHDKAMFSFRDGCMIYTSRLVVDDDTGDISIYGQMPVGDLELLHTFDTFMCNVSPLSYTFVDLGDKKVALVVCANMFSGTMALGKVRVVIVVISYEVLLFGDIMCDVLATRTFEYNCHSSDVIYTKLTSGFVL